jgi:hypothetical protein
MTIQNLSQRSGRFLGWAWEETLAASTTGDPVAIPPLLAGQRISVRTQAGTNSAKVQSTISSDAKVAAGTAEWDDWPPGSQVGKVSANIDAPVTALRCVTGSTTVATVLFEILV